MTRFVKHLFTVANFPTQGIKKWIDELLSELGFIVVGINETSLSLSNFID